jgi:hypothetical protein
MKGQLEKLELTLDEFLRKKAPWQMPDNARRTLANALWWLALIFGILQLLSAYEFWRQADKVNQAVDWANSLTSVYGTSIAPHVDKLGPFFYLSLIVLAVDGVILLLAVTKLKEHLKSGWNLLFYSMLLNVAYGVVRVFSEYGGGFGVFVWSFITSALGGYLLFQVRERFNGHKPAAHTVAVEKTSEKTAK